MEKNKSLEEEKRRLTYAIIYMSALVLVLFGLGPLE